MPQNNVHRAVFEIPQETLSLINKMLSGEEKQDLLPDIPNPMILSTKFDNGLIAQIRIICEEDQDDFEEYYEPFPDDMPSWDERYSWFEYWLFRDEQEEIESRQYTNIEYESYNAELISEDGDRLKDIFFIGDKGEDYEIQIKVI